MQRLGRLALRSWLAVSAALLVALVAALVRHGAAAGFQSFQNAGHGGTLATNFAAFCASWLALGGLAALSQRPAFARRHGLFWIVLVLVGFQWLNVVREPHRIVVGDFGAYFEAAKAMHEGLPIAQLPDRLYLYPPLLAALLAPLTPLGRDAALELFHGAGYLALLAVVVALYASLQRFRFSRGEAALAVGLLFFVNVPALRTLAYHQVNLWVEALVLASFLAWPRARAVSALALALAAHLKVYPALLALPFLLAWDVRWLALFAASNLAIVAGTSAAHGFQYYVGFLGQAAGLQEAALRNASVDAVLTHVLAVFGLGGGRGTRVLSLALRALFAGAFLEATRRLARRALLGAREPQERLVANGFALLPLAMLAVSPSIWEHHPVLLLLTLPVLAAALATPREAWLFLPAYGFLFWMPVFDIFPVSALRLLAFVLLLALLFVLARREGDDPPAWRARLAERLRLDHARESS
jgi:hypothetical protein